MPNTTHTPGPWRTEPTRHNGISNVVAPYTGKDGRPYHFVACSVAGRHNLPSREQGEEAQTNARLIAAAPDLLTALQNTTAALENWRILLGKRNDELSKTIRYNCGLLATEARTAITKATKG